MYGKFGAAVSRMIGDGLRPATELTFTMVPLHLLYHRDRHQPARLKALIKHLVEAIPPKLSSSALT